MSQPTDSWATGQLAEFLAALSGYQDSSAATLAAVERIGMAFEAEIVAVVVQDRIEACVGFPADGVPERELLAIANGEAGEVDLRGLGACQTTTVSLEGGVEGSLVVGRLGEEPFGRDELILLRGMGRTLSLSLSNTRLVETLRERQRLLEKLSRLQRSIAARRALDEVLDAIVEGAAELIGDPTVGLRLIDPEDPSRCELVSAIGVDEGTKRAARYSPVGAGAGGIAIERGELVVIDRYGESPDALDGFAVAGLEAAMAAPIFERGEVAGSLVVGSYEKGRTYRESEREMLAAFAEHAGLALNEARSAAETIHQAFHDALTGLPNRAKFLDKLEQALLRRGGRRDGVAVLFADLDGFKTINDSLGHAAGDELLVLVTRRLAESVRPEDLIARFGGDEFALLIEGIRDECDAGRAAERLLEVMKEPFSVRGREVFVSASIGIAVGSGEADHLLRNVDLAMYHAKSRGKGRYEMFEPGMHEAALKRLELEADLKRAIEREEFVIHYQPICGLESGSIVAVEALVRWQHPRRGMVPPNDFIPLAEESGQILPIGRWVMREACQKAALWRARYPNEPGLQVCVNLSGTQLERADLAAEVADALERAELEAESLVLEITESALMLDLEKNVENLTALKDLGVRIAVDDFGTGYSSLEYLRRFPLDILKIAKPFVDDLSGPEGSTAIARSIVDLAGSLGLSVVAEGIEELEQRSELLSLGCQIGQGFHFSEPLPPAEMDSLLLQAGVLGSAWATARELP